MRFPLTFTRVKPAAPPLVTLGADPDPNTAGLKPGPALDNLFLSRFNNASGWPAHRLAVAYRYVGGGAPVVLPCTVFLYDSATEHWYTLEAAKNLTADMIVFFDVVSLLDAPLTMNSLNSPSQGSIEAYIKVDDAGAPAGNHVFSVGADSSLF